METAEIVRCLKTVTGDQLRKELATCEQARAEYLQETDREIALIKGLIDVVEPRAEKSWCQHLRPAVDLEEPPMHSPPASAASTGTVDLARYESQQSNSANVLRPLSQAIQPSPKPKRKKIETLLAKVVTAKDIRTYLDVSGPTAAGAIAHQFNCTREAITDILETDSQFVNDGRGFWDLSSRVKERRERELQPINQVY